MLTILLTSLICGVYGVRGGLAEVNDAVLMHSLSQYGEHEVLQVPRLALLLNPAEDTAGQFSEVVHADLLVE